MRVLIDADGCPVVNESIRVAESFGLEVIIFCDTSHFFDRENVRTIFISKGIDAVDFAILNNLEAGDVVVTQDYGLASLVLSKAAYAINQNGMYYTKDNIEELLYTRYISKEMRKNKVRLKGPKKRDKSQNAVFEEKLTSLIRRILQK